MDKLSVNMARIEEIKSEKSEDKEKWNDYDTVVKTMGEHEGYAKIITNLTTKKEVTEPIKTYEVCVKQIIVKQTKEMTKTMKISSNNKVNTYSLNENDELVEVKSTNKNETSSQKRSKTNVTSNKSINNEKEPMDRSKSPKRKINISQVIFLDSPSKVQKPAAHKMHRRGRIPWDSNQLK